MGMEFWLVTTAHLEDRLWFNDEEDFKVGMNYVPIIATGMEMGVMAFVLMSNHVHFLLAGSKEKVQAFIQDYKKRYSQYYGRKYLCREFLRRNSVDIRQVLLGDESFERAVAYIHMNSVAANICLHPWLYPWSTGACFFNASVKTNGTPVESLSVREKARVFKTHAPIPPGLILGENGYIEPSSYVPVAFVESVFRTPKRMNYFLQSSSKARRKDAAPSFSDQLIRSALADLCTSLFQKREWANLSQSQLSELLRQLRYRFSADPHQLARVSGIPYETVCARLE